MVNNSLESAMGVLRGFATFSVAVAGLAVLASCGERDEILEGERLTSRGDEVVADAAVDAAAPAFSVPAAKTNSSWTHINGSAQHWVAHPALPRALSLSWTTRFGESDSRRNRTSATPVTRNGRIFVQDSLGQVVALNTSGAVLWRRSLTPRLDEPSEVGGGGLAVDADMVLATTGTGRVVALDQTNGDVLWDQDLRSYGGSAPALFDDVAYLSARDGSAWAIEKDNGRIRWQLAGPGVVSGFIGGPGPAITSKWALFPFGSGEVLSTYRQGGLRNWTASVSGGREGRAVNTIRDISGDPVIVGNKVYVGTTSGPVVALDLRDGERLWTARQGVADNLWVAGNSVFLVNDENKLMRLDGGDGSVLWEQQLPHFTKDNTKRREAIFAHFGPVVAGGRLILASSDGLVRFYDPRSGASLGTLPLPGGAAASPVVANNTLYLQSADGTLHAYR